MSNIVAVPEGEAHESWPWWLKSGMVVWMNHPDQDGPVGRVVGYNNEPHHRYGQPVYVKDIDVELIEGQTYDFRIVHPDFILPDSRENIDKIEGATT